MSSSAIRRGVTRAALAAVFVAGATVSAADTNPTAPDDSQPAVWTPKEFTFTYQGFTTKYSCDGLRDKVRGVLLDLGARKKDLKVTELGCSVPTGRPDPFPGVRVKMQVLQPASGSADEKVVPAHWKPVDLKLRNSYASDGSGECELVEQIRSRILPLFATRNVDLQTNCIPHQATPGRPSLTLQTLVPNKPADQPAAPAGH